MEIDRRTLIAALPSLAALPAVAAAPPAPAAAIPAAAPIGRDERLARLERARALMRAERQDALLIEPGASLAYFTGVEWWRSERLTAALLFARSEPVLVCPAFEEPSVRETLAVPADVRVWQEDASPFAVLAGALRDRGLAGARVGVEETARWFAHDGLAAAMPGVTLAPGAPVVRGCRMIKSAAEIALLRRANAITLEAMRRAWARVREGDTREALAAAISAETAALGGAPTGALVLVGAAAALPHGSRTPQVVREGAVVLMDCGCDVGGYKSDISRTAVLGRVPGDVRSVWEQVAEGQRVALAAARPGVAAGAVDDAVRRRYEALGYGPGYALPGLSHRTGHGIGTDGHEPVNLVSGEATPLAAGMCFSNEPGLYLPGRFGVRLEDCFHMTDAGPTWFTVPSESVERPFG